MSRRNFAAPALDRQEHQAAIASENRRRWETPTPVDVDVPPGALSTLDRREPTGFYKITVREGVLAERATHHQALDLLVAAGRTRYGAVALIDEALGRLPGRGLVHERSADGFVVVLQVEVTD